MDNTNVIIKPLITEKSTHLQNTRNTFVFEVNQDANKHQIKQAVEKLYSVKVADVRTMNRRGKTPPDQAADCSHQRVETRRGETGGRIDDRFVLMEVASYQLLVASDGNCNQLATGN